MGHVQGGGQPLTVNSHIASANPAQAQQGFNGAISNGNLPKQLSGIGLNYVPGSANVSALSLPQKSVGRECFKVLLTGLRLMM